MDMVSMLKDQLDRTGKVVANIGSDQLGRTTPCEKFDARGLINHICEGNHFMAHLSTGATGDPTAGADHVGTDHVGAYERSRDAAVGAFERPGVLEETFHFSFGDMPGEQALGLALLETVTHRWDLAKATGQDADIDPELAAMLLEGAKMQMSDQFRNPEGDPFGKAVDVPESASPVDKLVAFLGRKP